MSDKNLNQEVMKKSNGAVPEAGVDQGKSDDKPPVFYRCTCPRCGEEDLSLYDFGVFLRSDFLGVTSSGDKGCGCLELDGGGEMALICGTCDHRVFDEPSFSSEQLLDWARAEGEEIEMLTFKCPVCGTQNLTQVYTGVEVIREVKAVYTIPLEDQSRDRAEVALEEDRLEKKQQFCRYRCSKGHELAKDDGTPVETPEDLVEWLKARSQR